MNLISSLSVKKLYIPISWCDLATFFIQNSPSVSFPEVAQYLQCYVCTLQCSFVISFPRLRKIPALNYSQRVTIQKEGQLLYRMFCSRILLLMINLKFLEVNVIHVMLPVALSFHIVLVYFWQGKKKSYHFVLKYLIQWKQSLS